MLQNELRSAAAWGILLLVALQFAPFLTRSPIYAIGLPAVMAAAVLVAKSPATATVLACFVTAIIGSFEAFLGFSPNNLIDLMLAAIWLVVLIRAIVGRPYSFVVWPAVLGCAFYVGLTTIDLLTSENFGIALLGFKSTMWYLLTFLAIAYAGWSRETYQKIALGLIAITGLLSAYVVLRLIVGPADAERELASVTSNKINVDPVDESLRVVGSFQTAHSMSFWMAFMGPFCLAVALWSSGKWRIAAAAGALLCLLAIIISEVRGPLPGFVLGTLLVLAIYQGARAFPGFKAGVAVLAIGSVMAIGAGALAVTASQPERIERFERILDPTTDPTFAKRQFKWNQVLDSVEENPFGRGLGTAGAGQISGGDTVELAEFNIDNSYLLIAYEQGLFVMFLFIGVILALLISLIAASLRTRSKEAAAFGMGACGTLLSVMISFYTGLYIESPPIVGAWIVVGLGLSYFVSRAVAREPARTA